ncbi:MAG TPA: SBBP repeat-containing protein, partial [Bacteroidia bacterium]|nr:SBBP repeat-containing protein [Bacteroidia bacterium]
MKSLSTLNTKLKLLAVLATANLCAITSSAQNFEWAYSFGASSTDCGFGIGIDPSGNVYTAGAFTGTVDFNPSAGTLNLTAVGAEDIYVSKADAAGNFLWAVNVGSTTYDNALALVVDATGSVYVTGLYGSTADFDPGVGTVNLTPVGADDAFILKLDNLGNFVWAKSIGSNSFESGRSIALDANNNVLITGDFAGTTDFDPGIDTAYLTAAGGYYDAFVLTLNNNGDFLWAKQFGGVHDQTGRSIAVDGSGNVYVGGTFRWTTDFDPGAAVYPVIGDDSTTADLYICKFDASGNFVWVKTIGGADPFDEINLSTDA